MHEHPLVIEALKRIANSVQPIIHESGDPAYPYWLGGTAFLVGHNGKAWVATCRHAVEAHDTPIAIFATDNSKRIVPLDTISYTPVDQVSSDWADIALIRIDMNAALRSYARNARLIDMAKATEADWFPSRETSSLVLLGYPQERSMICYESKIIQTERTCLLGEYAGPGQGHHIHTMRMLTGTDMQSWSGFSGGPVFSWVREPGAQPRFAFAGVAIQGTPQSGLVHFVKAKIFMDALKAWQLR